MPFAILVLHSGNIFLVVVQYHARDCYPIAHQPAFAIPASLPDLAPCTPYGGLNGGRGGPPWVKAEKRQKAKRRRGEEATQHVFWQSLGGDGKWVVGTGNSGIVHITACSPVCATPHCPYPAPPPPLPPSSGVELADTRGLPPPKCYVNPIAGDDPRSERGPYYYKYAIRRRRIPTALHILH